MNHRFPDGLDVEREASPILNRWYKANFRNLMYILDVTSDPSFRQAGIDKFLIFKRPDVPRLTTISIDEKVRTKPYEDILAEIWSKKEEEIPGWVWTSKADYTVYAFVIDGELVGNPLFIPTVDFAAAIKRRGKEYQDTTLFKTVPKRDLPSKPPPQIKLDLFLKVENPDWRTLLRRVKYV